MKNLTLKIFMFIGFLLVLAVFGDLFFRGFNRYPFEPKLSVDGDFKRGKAALKKYGCNGCHVIPGIPGAKGRVGPKLEDIKEQIYIGGVLTNTPENMVQWIINPKLFSPETAMPNLGVTEEEAKDIADYLYNLKE